MNKILDLRSFKAALDAGFKQAGYSNAERVEFLKTALFELSRLEKTANNPAPPAPAPTFWDNLKGNVPLVVGGAVLMVPAAFIGSAMASKAVSDRVKDLSAGESPTVDELKLLTETRDLKKELAMWENRKKTRERKKQKEQEQSEKYVRKIF
jgi:hypothetical protein